jgi:hypothetical protein
LHYFYSVTAIACWRVKFCLKSRCWWLFGRVLFFGFNCGRVASGQDLHGLGLFGDQLLEQTKKYNFNTSLVLHLSEELTTSQQFYITSFKKLSLRRLYNESANFRNVLPLRWGPALFLRSPKLAIRRRPSIPCSWWSLKKIKFSKKEIDVLHLLQFSSRVLNGSNKATIHYKVIIDNPKWYCLIHVWFIKNRPFN